MGLYNRISNIGRKLLKDYEKEKQKTKEKKLKLEEREYVLSCIAKYFHYLRKVKRGELQNLPKHYKPFTYRVLMNKLIRENLLVKDYLCTECHQIFEDFEDYYNYLPIIFICKDDIELVCDNEKCREAFLERLMRSGGLLKKY